MFVRPVDLVQQLSASVVGGGPFEQFMRDLVLAEGALYGIPPTSIDCDYRTNCPDGGCDIFVRVGHTRPNPRLIPNKPSLWSLKAGAEGRKTTTFRKELEKHPLILDHLRRGDAFVWCAVEPASIPQRRRMTAACEALGKEHGFPVESVLFVWVDAIAPIVESYPNIIGKHLPNVPLNGEGAFTLDQWRASNPEKFGYAVDWVDIDGRDEIKQRVQAHLKAHEGDPVLHIAGISGIGKTRTVVEACRQAPDLNGVLYAPRMASVSDRFLRHIAESGCCVTLIVDEVSLTDWLGLCGRFRDLGDRIRIVSIGPARRDEHSRGSAPNLLLMAEPSSREVVMQVLRAAAGGGLGETSLSEIASWSGADLRLALLLLDATLRNPTAVSFPLRDIDGLWARIASLFADQLGDARRFRENFGFLSVSIDVGMRSEYASEVAFIASHFDQPQTALLGTATTASRVGLGEEAGKFFEASPRGLAIHVFADQVWPILERDLDRFLNGMPTDRLRRRFLERCQELRGQRREQVMEKVRSFFLSSLGHSDITVLADREKSRVFQAWAELDPYSGLAWLVRTVEVASDEQLRALDGNPDGSGGWRGRRQIVWLCENLACFAEYFPACERVLFRLAQVETETGIINNSTGVWQASFLPVLSNTEVPFPERLCLLVSRIRQSTSSSLPTMLSAAFEILSGHQTRAVPPAVVGGRIVPDEWRPETRRDLWLLRQEAGRELLKAISALGDELRSMARSLIIPQICPFATHGLTRDMGAFLNDATLSESQKRQLRAQLDRIIGIERSSARKDGTDTPPYVGELREWRKVMEPTGLRELVIDTTARDAWEVYIGERLSDDDQDTVFADLATRLMLDLGTLDSLREWMASKECKSGGNLGFQMGKIDAEQQLLTRMLDWLNDGMHVPFAVQYLAAVAFARKQLPQTVSDFLDAHLDAQPELVYRVTLGCDFSAAGANRILRCLPRIPSEGLVWCTVMAHGPWRERIAAETFQHLVAALLQLATASDGKSIDAAMDLIYFWGHGRSGWLTAELAPTAREVWMVDTEQGSAPGNHHRWEWLAGQLAAVYPAEIICRLARVLAVERHAGYPRHDSAEKLLTQLAREHATLVMDSVGEWVRDPTQGHVFHIWVLRGLFDAIGLEAVRAWLKRYGASHAPAIARHVDGPKLDEQGIPQIPPLADWLLTEFADNDAVFNEFRCGRHSCQVRVGPAREHKAERTKFLDAFRADPRPWVKRWIRYEEDCIESEIKRDAEWEVERERT